MKMIRTAALVHAFTSAGIVAFQLALALGVPWGAYAMGGAYPGQFPPSLRVAALVQAAVLVLLAALVLARAGVAVGRWARASRRWVWLAVVFATLSLILNLITPSAGERMIWAPVALVLFVTSLVVALRRGTAIA